jgi:RNA polymerase sigma-70 factor (ECF subfamily)
MSVAAQARKPEESALAVPLSMEADSMGAMYDEYFPVVWRGLRRLGVPEAQLEDAAQDVFLVIHRRHADFAGRSALKTWIYGIVVRVAKDHRRAAARHSNRVERLASLSLTEGQTQTEEGPAAEAERREAARLLQWILAEMDEDHRQILVLVELEQLLPREAAEALGISVRTCQRRLQAAQLVLSEKLASFMRRDGRSTP